MTTANNVQLLTKERLRFPRANLHRAAPRLTVTPRDFRTDTSPVIIVEDDGGFALGGNKVRQLDMILGSIDSDTTTVVAAAGPHSNLLRVLAAAAGALNLQAYLVLRGHKPLSLRGNQILYELAGARITWIGPQHPFDAVQDEAVRSLTTRLESQGHKVKIVDVRGQDAVTCALASSGLLDDVESSLPWIPTHIFLAAGSGGTAAGLLLALAARGWDSKVIAVSANVRASILQDRILRITAQAAASCGLPADMVQSTAVEVTDAFLGAGYEIPTRAGLEAIKWTGRRTGVFLDPTYTGKAMSGLLAHPSVVGGRYMFVHTGGFPAIFNHDWNEGSEGLADVQ